MPACGGGGGGEKQRRATPAAPTCRQSVSQSAFLPPSRAVRGARAAAEPAVGTRTIVEWSGGCGCKEREGGKGEGGGAEG